MTELKCLILAAVDEMKALNQGQMRRFLFETGLTEEQDITWPVAELREQGYLAQIANDQGIQYILTEAGSSYLAYHPTDGTLRRRVAACGEEYRQLFAQERIYQATYSEQANHVIPVFLSIRQGDKVLFKIQVIVHDVATAKALQAAWRKDAMGIYRDTWKRMAPDIDLPSFE